MNNRIVKFFHFAGARIRDMSQLIQLIIKKKPDFLILPFLTNNTTTSDSKDMIFFFVLHDIFLLKSAIVKSLLDCRVIVSKPTFQSDNAKTALIIENLKEQLSSLEIECIENDNINDRCCVLGC